MNSSISKTDRQSKGKLIVLDGGDGSGKATQSALLHNYFLQQNISSKLINFPNYDSFYGKMIAQFLRGEFGTLEHVSPYVASLMYACDRALVKEEMHALLQAGGNIISDRYISASMAHQGAKCTQEQERNEFLEWIQKLEYDVNDMPKEDVVIYLFVPWQQAKELTAQKSTRAYLHGETQDIQEKNDEHRKQSEAMYKLLADNNDHWVTIDCMNNGKLLSVQQIHKKIIQTLQERGIIKIS